MACGNNCLEVWREKFTNEDVARAIDTFEKSDSLNFKKAFAVILNNPDHPRVIDYLRNNFAKIREEWSTNNFISHELIVFWMLYLHGDSGAKGEVINQLKNKNLLKENNTYFFAEFYSRIFNLLNSSSKINDTFHFITELCLDYENIKNPIENYLYVPSLNNIQSPLNVLTEMIIVHYKGKSYFNELRLERHRRTLIPAILQGQEDQFVQKISQIKLALDKQSLNPQELSELRKLLKEMISASFRPSVRDFFWRNLEELTLEKNAVCGDFYLGAYGADDPQLKERVISLVRNRINGLDVQFNSTIGKNLRTAEQRFFYFVSLFLKSTFEPVETHAYWSRFGLYPLVVDLLKNLKLDDQITSNSLARFANQKIDSKYKALAKEILGHDFENVSGINKAEKRNQQYVYINGGYSPTSNVLDHESDLKSFIYNLFPNYTEVLSAGGVGGLISDRLGSKKSETAPFSQLLPKASDLSLEKAFYAATLKNYQAVLQDLSREKPESLTVVYGGHGNTNGFTLWDANFLSARDILKTYSSYPADTVIQSLFLQCYGGSTVMSDKRVLPKTIKTIDPYFSHYYPKNRCALAMSSHDEIGQYYTNSNNWDRNYWSVSFEGQPWSIEGVQVQAFDDQNVQTTPILTSNYLLDDLYALICGDHQLLGDYPWPECRKLMAHPFHTVSKKVKDHVSHLLVPVDEKMVQWTYQLIQAEFNDLLLVGKGQKSFESVYEKYLNEGKNPGYSDDDFYSAVKILSSPDLYFTTGMLVLGKIDRYRKFYNDLFNEFMKTRETEFENFNLDGIKSDTSSIAIDLLRMNILRSVYVIQSEKKKLAKEYRSIQRAALEDYMRSHAKVAKVRELYDSIRKCETALIE
jgi:hypothetical protein